MANVDENPTVDENEQTEEELQAELDKLQAEEDAAAAVVEADEPPVEEAMVPREYNEDDLEEVDEAPIKEELQYCNGLFVLAAKSDFTQDKRYCDAFLKQKGLFKGSTEE